MNDDAMNRMQSHDQKKAKNNRSLKELLRWRENAMNKLKNMNVCIRMNPNTEVKVNVLSNNSVLRITLKISLTKCLRSQFMTKPETR